ncbi:MAG TPA: hypothetical protein VJ256_01360 [Dehalococcoidia bacterium]|nr:hypothetical protein [Dehalococcoidia bacterium]HLB29822.1 hypothetical protein [Dehalococcoidia bacterium]
MGRTVSIWIPDDLEADLKEQSRINVSAICQEALRRELARLRPLGEGVEIPEEVVARLRQENDEYERASREKGFKAAIVWAKQARLTELKYWLDLGANAKTMPSLVKSVRDPLYEWIDQFGGSEEDLLQRYPALQDIGVVMFEPEVGEVCTAEGDPDAFKQGWLEGVEAFWNRVKEML